MDEQFRRLAGLVRDLAHQRVAEAVDALGTTDASPLMAAAVGATGALLGRSADQASGALQSGTAPAPDLAQLSGWLGDDSPVADGLGHHRPIYRPLALSMVLRRAASTGGADLPESCMRHVADRVADDARELHERLLWAWVWAELLMLAGRQTGAAIDAARALLETPGEDGAMHPQDPAESLDHWTYRELVGLHALDQISRRTPGDPLRPRLLEIARFHLHNTQPDHVTEHPWAVALFAQQPDTRMFAFQQIHDVSTGRESIIAAMVLTAGAFSIET